MKTIEIPIEKLMLDPNNYRLRGEQSYKYVEDKNVTNVMVQRRVLKMLGKLKKRMFM